MRTAVRDRGVITDHLEFGRRVLAGLELYAPYLDAGPLHAPYPPGFGLLCAPLSLLPERAARIGWGIAQVVALWTIGCWIRDAVRAAAPALLPRLHWLLVATAILASRYVLRDTHGGGGNLINLALALGAFTLAARGRDGAAGLLLGVSLATKPTMLLMLPLLWLLGHRRSAVYAVLTGVAWTGASLVLLGQGLDPLSHWLAGSIAYARMDDVFATPEYGFPPFTWMNQCLRCAVARYVGDVPAALRDELAWFAPGLGWSALASAWTARLAGLGLLVAVALVAVRRASAPAASPYLIAAVAAATLLLSPISWKAHHVALIPALALLCVHGASGHRWAWVFAAGYWLCCAVGEEVTGKAMKNVQQSLYVVTAGTLALCLLCLWWAARPRSALARDGDGR